MAVGLAVACFALLAPGFFKREGREKTVYLVVSLIAVAAAVIAGSIFRTDHVGASLSGMISIFMR